MSEPAISDLPERTTATTTAASAIALTRFIGCDVGKTSIVVFDTKTGQVSSLPNTPEALVALAATHASETHTLDPPKTELMTATVFHP